jgi:cytochrome b subunit of formate dehydrogenase
MQNGSGKRVPLRTTLVRASLLAALAGALLAAPWSARPAAALPQKECFQCHDGSEGPTVDAKVFAQTVHADLDCTDCHADIKETPHDSIKVAKVNCSQCHDKIQATYDKSVHGKAHAKGVKEAASCPDCHGMHNIFSPKDPRSQVYPMNLGETCSKCHANAALVKKFDIPVDDPYSKYAQSVHGRGVLKSGLIVSAVCNDCHGTHDILPHTDPASRINRRNIRTTCGHCHQGVLAQFDQSIHGRKLAEGSEKAPTCVVCHHSHTITRITDEDWKLHNLQECGGCHTDRISSYKQTYHGQVTSLGYAKVARCSDCHGSHNILPIKDPKSTLAPANIVRTCQKCHPKANANFAKFQPHAEHNDREHYPLVFYTFWAMTGLLVGTLAFFGIHTLLWLLRSLKEHQHAPPVHVREEKVVWRFRFFDRALHFLVITSFLTLAATGLPLRFAYTNWARTLAQFLGGFEAAGFVHRFAAIITFLYFGLHVGKLFRKVLNGEKGLFWGPDSMVPQLKDAQDMIGQIKWFFGLGERPKFDRFTYWEKFDYWAVFWGVTVIGLSGLVLWFPQAAARFLPGWAFNLAMIIHGDEALLATGFIFSVHFFNSHLRPEKFPMDFVIFTGRIEEAELAHERPLEYARKKASGQLELERADPLLPWQVTASRIVGFTALGIGLALLLMMISVLLLHS